MTNREANAEFSEFVAEKIRARVDDPAIAEKLIPTDHGFGMRRPPMETFYYEAYNRPNVKLVDLNETPLVTITEAGIETSDGERAFDIIVWATGFDGFTGALTRMDVVGEGGRVLRDQWSQGVATYLGAMVPGFPNFFMAGGPHLIAGNFPRATEIMVDYITGLLSYARANGRTYVAPDERGVRRVDRGGARARQDRAHRRELVVPGCQHPRQAQRVPALRRQPHEVP